tara:strand:+ start:330 stop:698 length:369 start_codon:yes stop_codon:yes gene_type:complete
MDETFKQSWLTANSGTGTLTGCSNSSDLSFTNLPNHLTLTDSNYLTTNSFSNTTMTPRQVNVAVFTITRDEDTNKINSTKFVKELWVEQKNGTSIDLIVAKQLGNDFDPELTIIKVIFTVSF